MIAFAGNLSHNNVHRFMLFAQGIAVLILGWLYYFFLREPGSLYGIAASDYPGSNIPWQGQPLISSLPSFLHVLAFICMTFAITGPGKSALLVATTGWYAVDTLFELAQYGPCAHWITQHVPGWFSRVPIFENVLPHFMFCTFDPNDLAAIGLGTIAAWFWITCNNQFKEIKS